MCHSKNLALQPAVRNLHPWRRESASIDEQWRKLELVVETARKVWGKV